MREDTTPPGYDHPQTDPIPSLGAVPPADQEPAQYDRPEPDLAQPADPGLAAAGPADPGPAATPTQAPTPQARNGEDTGAVLFGGAEVERFRVRWRELQADFVDDPAKAVQGADELVDELTRALTEIFAEHKRDLEQQWQGGGSGETEELRVALRRYRSFFDQLLNA
jgi:hypothetical protein